MSQKIVFQDDGMAGPNDAQRSNRIAICLAADELRAVVNYMNAPSAIKVEAHNAITQLQRMLCAIDGHPFAPDELQRF